MVKKPSGLLTIFTQPIDKLNRLSKKWSSQVELTSIIWKNLDFEYEIFESILYTKKIICSFLTVKV